MKLTPAQLTVRGRAFDHGYQAQRAVRLFQEGIGHTPDDDLALALGYPELVELAPDAEGDVVQLTEQRINNYDRRAVPWPRNLAVRAVRAIAWGWDPFPTALSAEARRALAREDEFSPSELPSLLRTLTRFQSACWEHEFELVLLMEALAGGEATIGAVCDLVESNVAAWNELENRRRTVIAAVGIMYDRLSRERAAAIRPRLEALLARYRDVDESGVDPARVGMPLRALDLALHGRLGYERSTLATEWGRDRTHAFFLDRETFRELMADAPRKKPLPHMLPSVQWVVQGGVAELENVGDPSNYKLRGFKLEAHRWVVDQFARLRAIEATHLLASIASGTKSQPLVVEALHRHPGLRGNFEQVASDERVPAPVRKAATRVLSKASLL